jgi:AcrR family transcriptional regulator
VNRRVPHLSREIRLEKLLIAASEIITESGISAVTMTAIAERSGVSRQWLHEFFPDVESIYVALYLQYRTDFVVESNAEIRSIADLASQISEECISILDLPVAPAVVLTHALHGLNRSPHSSLRPTLHEVFTHNLEVRYVQPLVSAGYDRNEVLATVLTIVNTTLGLVIASRNAKLDREVTTRLILDIVNAVIGDTIREPTSQLGVSS